jgi:hypothetical protein
MNLTHGWEGFDQPPRASVARREHYFDRKYAASCRVLPRPSTIRRHYLAVIQRKPGALGNGAPFTELPDAFKQLQKHLLRKSGGDREMV